MPRNWTDEELRAAIEAYLEMMRLDRSGTPYVKKDFYRDLATKYPGRTAKSFEFRAQNISHVFALLGRDWLPGLIPARNVGTGVVGRIEQILADVEGRTPTLQAQFENEVRQLIAKEEMDRPDGLEAPGKHTGASTRFERDPAVKAWVLKQAGGCCEACGSAAPFEAADGTAFLEVHHVRHLADGGSDRPENAVGVCPNCHRAFHYAADRKELIESIYREVSRLERE